ncbi:protein sel-1 homolog 3-like [Lineus longissimus]|uniref:protein sel-1 homolog 3-like n=1 Tax=Lineus longissimus TaxID=88925 RepID=UPI00315D6D41
MLLKIVFMLVICSFCCLLKFVYVVRAQLPHNAYLAHNNNPAREIPTPKPPEIEDSLEISEVPAQLQAQNYVTFRYTCSKKKYVGVTVTAPQLNDWVVVFRRKFLCDRTPEPKTKKVHLNLPDSILYKPGYFNRDVNYAKTVKLKLWIVEQSLYPRVKHDPYKYSTERKRVSITVAPPDQRPDKLSSGCSSWEAVVMQMLPYRKFVRCQVQPETIKVISYPIINTGHLHGVFRQFQPFTDKDYIKQAKHDGSQHKYTVSLWLYIKEFCKWGLCSILHRTTWDDVYRTPLVFLNKAGRLHIQIHNEAGESDAALTQFSVPKDEWFRLTLSFNNRKWLATLENRDKKKKMIDTSFTHKFDPYFNDTEGYTLLGGNDMVGGFKGYIGEAVWYRGRVLNPSQEPHQKLRGYISEAVWYRGRVLNPSQIPYPSPYHPMFELGIAERTRKCSKYLNWIRNRVDFCQKRLAKWSKRDTCPSKFRDFIHAWSMPKAAICSSFRYIPRDYSDVNRLIKQKVYSGSSYVDFKSLAESLFKNASGMIETCGLQATKKMVPLLKQSSCLGNEDAMYMLSVILSKGVGYKADEIQSHAYLMYAGLEGHRHSLMALGNKHINGLDGLPTDLEMAFCYYKHMADITKRDKDMHRDTDVFTEEIRLTDAAALDIQTDEDGDVFQWVKHQAHQGVLTAQRHMAMLLFWGQQGIQRNLQAAVEYYRMGAQQGDPQALFDYGIVLMKGQGTKKDVEEGLRHLDKAASKGSHQAINTLGWHAQTRENDLTKAVDYWERAYKMGNIDAAHNLGHMYFSGQYPGKQVDRKKAFEYHAYAAGRGQFDSGVMMGYYHIRGLPGMPHRVQLAVDWARFMSERNPKIGLLLRTALKAYKNQDWATAMFYYFLAAESGTEIATFNLAFLCEENHEGMTSYIEKECVWHYYNLSTLREDHQIDSYALLKMGDYYWYGCAGKRDVHKAIMSYERAAMKSDPQAIFNLAVLLEEGVNISSTVWHNIKIPQAKWSNKYLLLTELYGRCKESPKSEAYIPCRLALFRVQLLEFWDQYKMAVKMSSALATVVFGMVTSTAIYSHLRGRVVNTATV